MSIDLEVQKAIRARLVATPAVTDLVPPASILDRNQRPAPSPSIVLGESQEVDEGSSLQRLHTRVYHTIHVWKREPSLEGVKVICGAVRGALWEGRLTLGPGLHAADVKVSGTRAMRDPDGETSHGVVTVEVLVSGVPA
ncbi:DUF3168 domain-containing protein [Tropicimonas isoalkanivorans]|uniref:DUF3168 domain-containing protein n=1 Tax=Tropicimonas isoalkanivorans TaxID=441112 RepID=A0A1I1E540_9RHOB|nr:DUF3168 domain-containing protein [Tropicimonas isoalkanivorans]SFB82281.1 Protein of unknown function [Tropicimonas isoalkanivorans]